MKRFVRYWRLAALWTVGLFGFVWQVFVRHAEEPFALAASLALMGLPFVLLHAPAGSLGAALRRYLLPVDRAALRLEARAAELKEQYARDEIDVATLERELERAAKGPADRYGPLIEGSRQEKRLQAALQELEDAAWHYAEWTSWTRTTPPSEKRAEREKVRALYRTVRELGGDPDPLIPAKVRWILEPEEVASGS